MNPRIKTTIAKTLVLGWALALAWALFACAARTQWAGELRVQAANMGEHGAIVSVKRPLVWQFIPAKQFDHVQFDQISLNLTRAGRQLGDLSLRQNGVIWQGKNQLELPGTYVLSLRLFKGKQVWAAATDLEASTALLKGQAILNLDFTLSSGKAGADTSGWWAVLTLVGLLGLVVFIVRYRQPDKSMTKKNTTEKTAEVSP